jgi:membrane protein DedA with SNARE-associated domain
MSRGVRPPAPPEERDDAELPRTFVQLIAYLARLAVGSQSVVGSWPNTLQLAFVICVPVCSVAILVGVGIVAAVYLKLDAREWGLVASCVLAAASGTSALNWAGHRVSARRALRRSAITGGEDQTTAETPRT